MKRSNLARAAATAVVATGITVGLAAPAGATTIGPVTVTRTSTNAGKVVAVHIVLPPDPILPPDPVRLSLVVALPPDPIMPATTVVVTVGSPTDTHG
jgi:hypothetical protein